MPPLFSENCQRRFSFNQSNLIFSSGNSLQVCLDIIWGHSIRVTVRPKTIRFTWCFSWSEWKNQSFLRCLCVVVHIAINKDLKLWTHHYQLSSFPDYQSFTSHLSSFSFISFVLQHLNFYSFSFSPLSTTISNCIPSRFQLLWAEVINISDDRAILSVHEPCMYENVDKQVCIHCLDLSQHNQKEVYIRLNQFKIQISQCQKFAKTTA